MIERANIDAAFKRWASGDAGKKNLYRVEREFGTSDAMIDEICQQIATRSLAFAPIRRYEKREGTKGKLRLIGIESIKQQVCDYLAVDMLTPLLDAKIGYWQVASVKGKGQLMLVSAIERWMRDSRYHVHLDVRKCYPSIKTESVSAVLHRYVRSPDVLYLCDSLLGTFDGCLEIGSYFSLKMANLLLSFGYHHIEGLHKVRRGKQVALVEHQGWYADDIFLFSNDKRDLKMAVRSICSVLHERFGLELKNWKVEVVSHEPCSALGYTVRRDRVTLEADLYLRIRRSYRAFDRYPTLSGARRVCSYWGYLKNSDSYKAIEGNEYGRIAKSARRMVSAHDRAEKG